LTGARRLIHAVDIDEDDMFIELHGSLQQVICLHCHAKTPRTHIQTELIRLNPRWAPLLSLDEKELKMNADGDVDLRASLLDTRDSHEYRTFRYPPCPACLNRYGSSSILQVDADGAWKGGTVGIIKPAVIFFGENVSSEMRQLVNNIIDASDQMLIIGTTLAVLSAQRLVRTMKSQGKRIAVLTSGYVRNEETLVHDNDIRIWWKSSDVLKHISYFRKIPP
jgi:NAD-dependent SIR2 family protein deacetylase